MKTDEQHPSQLVGSRLARAADFCVLLAFVVFLAGCGGLVLVVSGQVVRGWAVSIVLLIASVVLVIIRAAKRRRSGPGTGTQGAAVRARGPCALCCSWLERVVYSERLAT